MKEENERVYVSEYYSSPSAIRAINSSRPPE